MIEKTPKKEYILDLLREAVLRTSQIGEPYKKDLVADFVLAQETLQNMPGSKSQQALVISATRTLITQGEKKTIALIVGDDPITGQQMSHLVRVRFICAELSNLLATMLEVIRASFRQTGYTAANIT